MWYSIANESLQIILGKRELKEVDHFKCLGKELSTHGYRTRETKMIIVMAKEAFNINLSLLTIKLKESN